MHKPCTFQLFACPNQCTYFHIFLRPCETLGGAYLLQPPHLFRMNPDLQANIAHAICTTMIA